jgi:hypothetical protein
VGEHVFKFLTSEIKKIRLVCQRKMPNGDRCGGVAELTLEQVRSACKCPACDKEYIDQSNFRKIFGELSDDFRILENLAENVQVEFVVPDPAKD